MSENTLTIREVGPGDCPAWGALWDGYNRFYGREGPTALPADITALTWARFLDLGATRVYWQTHETNATAMRLYDRVAERTGFVIYRKLV